MGPLTHWSSFDIGVAVILLFFLVRGVWIGFVRQLAAFFALVGSYLVAGRYCGELMPLVERYISHPKAVFLASFALLFVAGALVCIFLGTVLHKMMQITLLGWFDRFLGLLLGFCKGFLAASIIYMLLSSTLSGTNELLRRSLAAPYLAQGAALLRLAINDKELRNLFVPKQPAIQEKLDQKKPDGEAPLPAGKGNGLRLRT